MVRFQGAIATAGTNSEPFVLPRRTIRTTNVYVPIDLCSGTNARLEIEPTGDVLVQAEGGTFTNAQCFTSLDGTSFVP